jgi:hypothetical protein
LQVLVGSWGRWPPQGFVSFVPQSLYLSFEFGMIALWGQELLRLQVCNLPLYIEELFWVLADPLHLSDWLGVLCYPHQYLLRLCERLSQLFEPGLVLVDVNECHDGALILDGYQGRSGFR